MKRTVVAACACIALIAGPGIALAENRAANIGNYYFEDVRTSDRTKIVVRRGDQVTFTVRETAARPHTVEVEELGINSGDLLIGQTYTTPVLDRPGNFYLFCGPHESRGHHARLIVQAPPSTPSATARATPTPAVGPATGPPTGSATTPPRATLSPTPSPTPTPVPAGVATADPSILAQLTPNPDSLAGLTGVSRSHNVPWTRAVWWLLIACVPIVGVAVFALRREAILRAAADRAERLAAERAATQTSRRKPRKR